MAAKRITVWAVLALLVAALGWGTQAWLARQERLVHAPQRLLEHLQAVQAGRAELDAAALHARSLRADQRAWLRTQLVRDLEATAHPDPEAGAESLLIPAMAPLDEPAALSAALGRRLRALPPPWETRQRDDERWRLASGDQCLELAHVAADDEPRWQWTSLGPC